MKPADIELLHVLGKPTVSPDGRFAVVPVIRPELESDEYRGHLWIVPTDGSAPPRPFTTGWRDSVPAYSPDGQWLAFLRASQAGTENKSNSKPQLYVMPTSGGEPRRVTDHPLGAGAPVWSPDSAAIAYVARVPDEGRYSGKPEAEAPRRITTLQYRLDGLGFFTDRRAHVFVVDPFGEPDAHPIQVTSGDFDHEDVAWSPDGHHLAFVSARHDTRDTDLITDVWLCAADGSHLRPVTDGSQADGPRLSCSSVTFTPDGDSICFAGLDLGSEGQRMSGRNTGVWSVPADASAPPTRLTDVETIHVARETAIQATSEGVLACVERRGAVELLLIPYKDHLAESLAGGNRQVEGFASTESILVFVAADPASRGELFAMDKDRTERQLTSLAAIASRPMEEITTTAPDGYPVHGWIVRPEGPGPHPVLLMIHGGPATQYGWRLFDESQVYAGAGYAVIMGNPRGSSGYGEKHGTCIVGNAAAIAAADLLALLDAGLATGGLDSSRVGVLGGSYGGYMTTWLSAHHGDRFKAGISERAVNAIDSFHGSSDIGWFFGAELWGDDPAGWIAQNPLSFADQINLPLLIIHSEHDWRCPVEQAERLFVALKLRGAPTEMLLFPAESHGLTRDGRPKHRVARFEAVLDWWASHL
jgi:dipeptidyl aminopeptidase/acylaminoacyl peptidase